MPHRRTMWGEIQRYWGRLRGRARTGDWGEQAAAEWLGREHRFAVVARNWRNPQDRRQEIDLVCRDGEVLVFVEVKTRSASALVPGYFAVDRRKKRVLLSAIRAYLGRLSHPPRTVRFDIVEVAMTGSAKSGPSHNAAAVEIRHFEAVPLFPKHFHA